MVVLDIAGITVVDEESVYFASLIHGRKYTIQAKVFEERRKAVGGKKNG